ncbi:DUF4349 domain-containing protein [Paenibacillus sp. IB182493]|uniref:DUF4349 domain-containing protein n=2 Tax=Paenibacillus arenilitoris TaxID=2772299 RepID=A0A927H639_9BACL|nr:DUF4349 domain-containing protein [Paenibacillus arenilitoris]
MSNAAKGQALTEESGSVADSAGGDSEALAIAAADGGAASDEAAGGGIAADALTGGEAYNQKIIYSASLTMQVDDVGAASSALRQAIGLSGAYIMQFQDTRHDGEIGASYTVKVPADGFMSFIDRIEQIEHRSFERNIGSKDVSEEYVDLESRLKARQLVEERLLSMMEKAAKADDLLKFSQQLGDVQEEIERIKGRIRYLDNNVAFSTVELRLYQTDQAIKQAGDGEPNLGTRLAEALAGSTKAVWEGLKFLLVAIAGAIPVIVVLAVVAVPAVWVSRRLRRPAKAVQVSPDEEREPSDPDH